MKQTTRLIILAFLAAATGSIGAQVKIQGLGDKVCPATITATLGNTPNVSIARTTLTSRDGKLSCIYQTTAMVTVQTTVSQCRDVPVREITGPLMNIMKLARDPSVSYQGATPSGGTCKVKPIIRLIQK